MAFDGLLPPLGDRSLLNQSEFIFCIQSSTKPVNVISNAFINDENQLFKTIEPS